MRGGGGFGRPRLTAAAALLVLAGCYNYTPVQSGAVPHGSDVRVHVARGVDLSAGAIPLEGGSTVRGKILRAPTADTLFCDVLLQAPAQGTSRGLRSTVSIPMRAVEQVEVRSLDRARTGGLVAAGALLAWIIVDASFDIHNAKEGTDEPGDTNQARITLFRWGW